MKNSIGAQDKAESHRRDHDFPHRSHDEGTQSLLLHFAQIGSESDSGKCQQESPARQIPQTAELFLIENA